MAKREASPKYSAPIEDTPYWNLIDTTNNFYRDATEMREIVSQLQSDVKELRSLMMQHLEPPASKKSRKVTVSMLNEKLDELLVILKNKENYHVNTV
jgi:hypothetical protein